MQVWRAAKNLLFRGEGGYIGHQPRRETSGDFGDDGGSLYSRNDHDATSTVLNVVYTRDDCFVLCTCTNTLALCNHAGASDESLGLQSSTDDF